MRIWDRKTVPWCVGSLLAFAGATGAYLPYAHAHPSGPQGGSWPGLIYAAAGSLMILFALFLSLRRRFRTVRAGSAYFWMQAHIWLGALSYPVILYHAGFRWGGELTQILMWLFTVVVLSGVTGLALQQFLPARLKRDVPRETVLAQAGHVMDQLRAEADALVAAVERGGGSIGQPLVQDRAKMQGGEVAATAILGTTRQSGLIRSYYEQEVHPLLDRAQTPKMSRRHWKAFDARFSQIRGQVPTAFREAMDDLRAIVDERFQMERQRRLMRFLHGWLIVHVPVSYAMAVLACVHAVYALKYAKVGGW